MLTWEDQVEIFESVKHIKYEIFRSHAAIHYKGLIDVFFKEDKDVVTMLLNDYEDCLTVFEYLTNGNVDQALRKFSSLDTAARDEVFNVLKFVYDGL